MPVSLILLERCAKVQMPYRPIIGISLVVLTLAQVPLVFFWDTTAELFGHSHSVVLLACTFIAGISISSSDVVVLPYMKNFDAVYLPTYFVGT